VTIKGSGFECGEKKLFVEFKEKFRSLDFSASSRIRLLRFFIKKKMKIGYRPSADGLIKEKQFERVNAG
jgi:hypothetical protein